MAALPGDANRIDEWSVPNPSGTPTTLDRNRDRNRIPISIPISGMAHPAHHFNQTACDIWKVCAADPTANQVVSLGSAVRTAGTLTKQLLN